MGTSRSSGHGGSTGARSLRRFARSLTRAGFASPALGVAAFSASVCVVMVCASAALGLSRLTFMFSVFAVPYALISALAWRGFTQLAQWTLFLVIDAGIVWLACLLGPQSQVPVMFVVLLGYPYLVLQDTSSSIRRVALLLAPATLLLLEVTDYSFISAQPITTEHLHLLRLSLLGTTFVAAVIMLEAFAAAQEARRRATKELSDEQLRNARLEADRLASQAAANSLRELVETAPAALATVRHGQVVFANRAARELFAFDEGLLPVPARQLLTAQNPEALEDALRGDSATVIEVELCTPSGVNRPAALTVKAHATEAGTQYLMLRDLSDERRVQAERQRLDTQLQQSQKLESLGVLAGGIAHDFNNLLTGILGNASYILEKASWSEHTEECCREIETASERAADLCRQMLAYAGKAKLEVRAVELNSFADDAKRLLRLSVARTTELVVQRSDQPLWLRGDTTQLRQLTMNLVMNASEALDGQVGRVVLAAGELSDVLESSKDYIFDGPIPSQPCLYLDVSDEGCGMSPAQQARIFEPFYTTKFSGRGLGLSAARGIVQAHGGALGLRSAVGKGSSFRVVLPQCVPPLGADPTRRLQSEPPRLPWKRVLIVDDEPAVRNVLQRMLRLLGVDSLTAEDGLEAISIVESTPVELVILDLTMPRLSGAETLKRLNAIRADLPVVLVSGFDAQDDSLSGFRSKRLPFIHKPFRLEELATTLGQLSSTDFTEIVRA